ncbi:MAG: DUF1499 domain-containing protein [Sandarakinorhabdus sp.]|nr:DUF1499 domain-containing protein [Sandarakinorhabdus sp.]
MAIKTPGAWTWRIARATLVAALLVVLAGPLMTWGVLGWQAGLGMFVMAAVLAGLGGLFCLWALLRRRGSLGVVLAAAAGIAAIAVPAAIVIDARAYPPINDITTDTVNPPAFAAITAAMRGPGASALVYEPSFAAIQAKGYPKLAGLVLPAAPDAVFVKAMAAAKDAGWTVIIADAAAGRIEATATVPWWGFKDDVVIRLTPAGTGTRVDMRSKSRVGKGDLGVNAKRINDFLDALKA